MISFVNKILKLFPDLPQMDLIMIFPRVTKLGRKDVVHVAIQVSIIITFCSKKLVRFTNDPFIHVTVKRSSF